LFMEGKYEVMVDDVAHQLRYLNPFHDGRANAFIFRLEARLTG